MGSITVAGPSNWRAAFEGRPGLAVTPENYDRLLAEGGPQPEPQPELEAEAEAEPGPVQEPVPAAEPAAPPRVPPRRAAEDGG